MRADLGLVLAPRRGKATDDATVGGACVRRFIHDDGESWLCFYSARDEDFDQSVLPLAATGRIHLATSVDGVEWERQGPVLSPNTDDWYFFDTTHVGIGDVQIMSSEKQRTGGVAMYWCYYFGGDASEGPTGRKGGKMCIGLAMSYDGRTWGRMEGPEPNGAVLGPGEEGDLDAAFVGWPQVLQPQEGQYVMLYHTIDTELGTSHTMAATSKDGVSFSKVGEVLGPNTDAGAFDAKGVSARHVFEAPNGEPARYLMAYEGISAEGVHAIGLAASDDCLEWTRVGNAPIFERNHEPDSWDSGAVGRPHVVPLDGDRLRMYYYGQSGQGLGTEQETCGIGAAECSAADLSLWTRLAGAADPRS